MHAADMFSFGYITDIVFYIQTFACQRQASGLQRFGAARHDRDFRTCCRKGPRHRQPDALAAAGDDGNPVIHIHAHPATHHPNLKHPPHPTIRIVKREP